MAYGMDKGMGSPMESDYAGMFDEGGASGGGEDMEALFAEDEGEGADPLMDALIGAGFSPNPKQLDQIKMILESENSGQKPEGMEYSEEGMTASM